MQVRPNSVRREELGTRLPKPCGYWQLLAFRTGKESFLQEGSHGKLTTVQWKNTYPRLPGEQTCLEGFKSKKTQKCVDRGGEGATKNFKNTTTTTAKRNRERKAIGPSPVVQEGFLGSTRSSYFH